MAGAKPVERMDFIRFREVGDCHEHDPDRYRPGADRRLLPPAPHGAAEPFGSVLRDDFGPESDVDVLVEFEPGHTPGWDFFGMQDELTAIIGRRVDLNTPNFLSRYFRDEVVAGALPIYESRRD